MRALVLSAPDCFELRDDVAMPVAGPDQVLLRVRSTTMCGTDQKILAGQFPGTRFPHIPGHEFSGEVVETGERVGVEVHVGCGRCPRCLEGLYQLCLNYGRP